jgi:hypothetical protein
VVSWSCGIGGLWRRSKSVWRIFLLPARLETSKMGFSWGVYGSNLDGDKRLLWEELVGLFSW